MKTFAAIAFMLCCACGLSCAYAGDAPKQIKWPHGAKAALALTYDDALDSQLDIALPQLDAHGLKGTFFLTVGNAPFYDRVDEWRAAAKSGHELANHTIFHPCRALLPGRDWVKPENDLDTYTVARMAQEVKAANGVLKTVDGETVRTFAYPCGDALAGGKSYIDAIRPYFIAARSVMDSNGLLDDGRVDAFSVTTYGPEGASGADLIAYAEKVRDEGGVSTFIFHGVGGDYLTVSAEAHEELLDWLADHRDEIWVDSFRNIMAYVNEQQAK